MTRRYGVLFQSSSCCYHKDAAQPALRMLQDTRTSQVCDIQLPCMPRLHLNTGVEVVCGRHLD